MSGIASPPHKEDEQEQNDTSMLLFVLFFLCSQPAFLGKKVKILLNFTPPEALFLNNSIFMHTFAP